MKKRIVVLDGYTLNPGDNPWTELAALGELEVYDRTAPDQIIERTKQAEIILTNKTPLTAETIQSLPLLEGICVLATGYNVVDVAAARERKIPVCNVPAYGTESVAQHTMALILELANRVGLHHEAVKNGEWSRCPDFSFWRAPLIELQGKTLGVIGYGRIGRRVAEMARGFGMKIMAVRPRSGVGEEAGVTWSEMNNIFKEADVITLHSPLNSETQGLVNYSRLSQMKRHAFLINTARGAFVNEVDLALALNEEMIAGAALDVVSVEPMPIDHPLLQAKNCIITPHLAWSSRTARERLMRATVENVRGLLMGRAINQVNLV